jgi:hypothetical protein
MLVFAENIDMLVLLLTPLKPVCTPPIRFVTVVSFFYLIFFCSALSFYLNLSATRKLAHLRQFIREKNSLKPYNRKREDNLAQQLKLCSELCLSDFIICKDVVVISMLVPFANYLGTLDMDPSETWFCAKDGLLT